MADELSKVQQPSDQQGSCKDGYTGQDTEQMLWEYEPGMSPGELADEDYEELLLAMERALYDDLEADLRCQGITETPLEAYSSLHNWDWKSLTGRNEVCLVSICYVPKLERSIVNLFKYKGKPWQ